MRAEKSEDIHPILPIGAGAADGCASSSAADGIRAEISALPGRQARLLQDQIEALPERAQVAMKDQGWTQAGQLAALGAFDEHELSDWWQALAGDASSYADMADALHGITDSARTLKVEHGQPRG